MPPFDTRFDAAVHPLPPPVGARAEAPSIRAEAAYRVPWRVDRRRAPWYALLNIGDEPAHAVQLSSLGDGRLLWQPLLRVEPGGQLTFVLRADDPARDCIATLRWFRPNGDEYLWRIAF